MASVFLSWDAIHDPNPGPCRPVEPVTCDGVRLGTARGFRHLQGQLVATLTTDRDKWQEMVGDPDEPRAAYAGPYKIIGGR